MCGLHHVMKQKMGSFVACKNWLYFQYRNPDMTQVLCHINAFRVDKVTINLVMIDLINEI